MFTKQELLGAKCAIELVEIEANGKRDVVYVRGMSGTERDVWEQTVFQERKKAGSDVYPHYRASLIVKTACDKEGNRLFSDEDIKKVSLLPASVTEPIHDKASRLSGITQADAEELAKNLPSDQSEDST